MSRGRRGGRRIRNAADVPPDLWPAVKREFGRCFSRPYTDPLVVVMNALLMCGGWYLLPSQWQDWLFTFHGPLAFAMVLAGWMYADVPATNVLASDASFSLAALDDPNLISRLLVAKNIVLWCLVTPICTVVALIIGALNDAWPPTILSLVVVVAVPAGALGVSAWVGVLLPYHPIPLKDRWQQREHRTRRFVRWLVAVLLPYGLVPVLATIIMLPSLLLWQLVSPEGVEHRVPTTHFAGGVVLAVISSAVAWVLGHRYALRLVAKRRDRLAAYLADPTLG